MKKIPFLLIAVLPMISCKGGGEVSPEVQKYEEQQKELEALGSELTELRIKSRAAKTEGPKKPVEDLRKVVAEKEAELSKLNDEFKELEASEAAAIQALQDYKEKYPLPE